MTALHASAMKERPQGTILSENTAARNSTSIKNAHTLDRDRHAQREEAKRANRGKRKKKKKTRKNQNKRTKTLLVVELSNAFT